LVALQIKSGESYFKDVRDGNVVFRPDEKHRNYWSGFPIPVILILHRPTSGALLWVDATRALKDATPWEKVVSVPLSQQLGLGDRDELFKHCGPLACALLTSEQLVHTLSTQVTKELGFQLSFLELFLN